MDNAKIEIIGDDPDIFKKAMEIAFDLANGNAEAYAIIPDVGLVFYKYPNTVDTMVRFPFKVDYTFAADFAFRWLSEQEYERHQCRYEDLEREISRSS